MISLIVSAELLLIYRETLSSECKHYAGAVLQPDATPEQLRLAADQLREQVRLGEAPKLPFSMQEERHG